MHIQCSFLIARALRALFLVCDQYRKKAMRHNFVNQKGSAGGCASERRFVHSCRGVNPVRVLRALFCARAARHVLCAWLRRRQAATVLV
jgi:hypothetical protein